MHLVLSPGDLSLINSNYEVGFNLVSDDGVGFDLGFKVGVISFQKLSGSVKISLQGQRLSFFYIICSLS